MAILDLPEGEHQYKFFVDGQWTHDPSEVRFSSTPSMCVHRGGPGLSLPVAGLSERSSKQKLAGLAGRRDISDPCWPGQQADGLKG